MFYDASRLKDGYNIAFFDIDGTLTPRAADTHDGSIPPSERVGAALRQFVEAGNAPEHLRREATLVTGTVDEDGVADALDELRQIWS